MSEPSFPRVVLVDAPSFDANIRFDLNSTFGSAMCLTNADGFSLGAPTLDVEPGASGGSYGYRSVTLTPRIEGPKAAALSLLSALARELLRPENWLLIQLDALTEPVWFHLYQSQPAPLSLDEVYVDDCRRDDAWQTSLTLTADAFALGERITLDPLTFTQSPTGLSAALPAIKGDATTPLRVTFTPTGNTGRVESSWLLATASDPDAGGAAVVDIGTGDGFGAGTGIDSGSSGADDFGGSHRTVTVANTDTALVDRLVGALPSTLKGRQRVLLRAYFASGISGGAVSYGFQIRMAATGNSNFAQGPVATHSVSPASPGTNAGLWRGWVDLGDFTFPMETITTIPDAMETDATSSFVLAIQSIGGSAGTIAIDAFCFIPVDPNRGAASSLTLDYPEYGPGLRNGITRTALIDGDAEAAVLLDAATGKQLAGTSVERGGFPHANPAAEANYLTLFPTGQGRTMGTATPSVTSVGATTSAVVSYQPKFLHLSGDPDA